MKQSKNGKAVAVLTEAQIEVNKVESDYMVQGNEGIQNSIDASASGLGTEPTLLVWEAWFKGLWDNWLASGVAEKTAEGYKTATTKGLAEQYALKKPQSAKAQKAQADRQAKVKQYEHMSNEDLVKAISVASDSKQATELGKMLAKRNKDAEKDSDKASKDLVKNSIKAISDWIKSDSIEAQISKANKVIAFIESQQ